MQPSNPLICIYICVCLCLYCIVNTIELFLCTSLTLLPLLHCLKGLLPFDLHRHSTMFESCRLRQTFGSNILTFLLMHIPSQPILLDFVPFIIFDCSSIVHSKYSKSTVCSIETVICEYCIFVYACTLYYILQYVHVSYINYHYHAYVPVLNFHLLDIL